MRLFWRDRKINVRVIDIFFTMALCELRVWIFDLSIDKYNVRTLQLVAISGEEAYIDVTKLYIAVCSVAYVRTCVHTCVYVFEKENDVTNRFIPSNRNVSISRKESSSLRSQVLDYIRVCLRSISLHIVVKIIISSISIYDVRCIFNYDKMAFSFG